MIFKVHAVHRGSVDKTMSSLRKIVSVDVQMHSVYTMGQKHL